MRTILNSPPFHIGRAASSVPSCNLTSTEARTMRLQPIHLKATSDLPIHHQGDASPQLLSACLLPSRVRDEAISFPPLLWMTYPLISLCSGCKCIGVRRGITSNCSQTALGCSSDVSHGRSGRYCGVARLSWRLPRASRCGRLRDCSHSCGGRVIGNEEGVRPGFQVPHWTPVSSLQLPSSQCLHSSEVGTGNRITQTLEVAQVRCFVQSVVITITNSSRSGTPPHGERCLPWKAPLSLLAVWRICWEIPPCICFLLS